MRRSAHSIEPVRKELRLSVAPTEAFRHFTHEMGEWWPLGTHSIAALEASGVRFEGRVGEVSSSSSPAGRSTLGPMC